MPEYIFESKKNKELEAEEGIILLPDIYCQTDYSKKTTEDFAESFKRPVFLLDYFHILTGEANDLDGEEREKAHELMDNLKGEEFRTFFNKAVREIREAYPNLANFSVIGFCFGGRLAYIAGAHPNVSRVVSFYGGGANNPYIEGQSAVEYLVAQKGANISITSFFGTNDPSIPEDDRQRIKEKFINAGIGFNSHEYDAGHAYFQEGRKNYNEAASSASWEILKQIFNG